jgi:dethiobiotin synthetase
VIIVAKHNEQCIERLVLAWSYARAMGLTVAGTVTVETAAGEGKALEAKLTRSEVNLLLNSRTQVPYLGCLKHSPSISVHRVNQGNLVKMTEAGIDMLAVRQALEATVAK